MYESPPIPHPFRPYPGHSQHLESPSASLDQTFVSPSNLPSAMASKSTKKTRTRTRCNWKDCNYKAENVDDIKWVLFLVPFLLYHPSIGNYSLAPCLHGILYREHVSQHRKCPADNCMSEFKTTKEIERHIWKRHRVWAARTGYHTIDATCSICGNTYERSDFLTRHFKEEHDGQKRERKSGG